ncbi:hypothetical protein ACE1MK_05380 [Tenacibaculum maritimum]|uniref:hypothetical protein n=2 Tax=Tenacibaculum maritimum TaxID=107401 RepID=UPI0012E4F23F|nr:conserved hypothetical protein [Tenacibaculum maritimum]CAA0151346.1 conserved hypothetical protein [Tenacibaculum maritimum]CAA0161139.1 conserved hypothetical protein [Tenacibaculum maritimum]CAA0180152.1 conserved hypothetical protein [Tenacibaculum maritimum]CAA0200247.1 conserved hypothetical protein [Tenacibaculum maritimum]
MFPKISTYFFVVLYLVAMLRPMAPLVTYAINYDYISKVLCVNKNNTEMNCKGKCYVMKQLQQQQEDDFNALQISMKDYPIGFIELMPLIPSQPKINITKPFFLQQKYSYLADRSVFHPPNTIFIF